MHKKIEKLEEYKKKRNFGETPEPKAELKASKSGNLFVVQKHHASHLHYDFRLEIDGVLKSWAVPKGPSMDPGEKRLAVLTEDHPLDYANFEGIIPEGYGAGTVIVWDTGTYENISTDHKTKDKKISIEEAFNSGHIKIILDGKKLKGAFTITNFRDSNKNWLLIKIDDEYAQRDSKAITDQTNSVLSKKSIESLDKEYEKIKKS